MYYLETAVTRNTALQTAPVAPPPVVPINKHNPMLDYFHDGCGNYWGVARLHALAADLPVFDCPLAVLELNGRIWTDNNMIELANHCKRVMEADLQTPILIDWTGGIADGRHRVIKALIEGRATVKAKRLLTRPEPCQVKS